MAKISKGINKEDYSIFVVLTMYISGASFLMQYNVSNIIFLILLFYFFLKKRVRKFNRSYIYILFSWLCINVLSCLYWGSEIVFTPFLGKIVLLTTAYLAIACIDNFWEKYEMFLYRLVVISLFLYILNLLFPTLFDDISSYFRPITNSEFLKKETQKNYFYSFFYVYIGYSSTRNCGFMWEPGAFAMMLIILLAYNLSRNGFKFDNHFKIYSVALFTTFSTAGYLSFFIFIIYFFLSNSLHLFFKILLLAILLLSLKFLITTDFLLPKLESFIASAENEEVFHQSYRDFYEANRLLSFKLLFEKFLMYPLGWGCINDTFSYTFKSQIVTVNGLGHILYTWGIFMSTFFLKSIWSFLYRLNQKSLLSSLLLIAILIMFFSNPIEDNLILYILIFSFSFMQKPKKNSI